MSVIWEACAHEARIGPLSGTCWRMVESQEEVATRGLVDSLEKQAILEELLEQSKPPRPDNGELHYLLVTPFRYPPLPHGSRFGGRFEPSLFYASIDRSALLAESSYYRFVFCAGLKTAFSELVASSHTAFSVRFATGRGVALDEPPFAAFGRELCSPTDYSATQALGARLRAEGVEVITYRSARDREGGRNVALYTKDAFSCSRPEQQIAWRCEAFETYCIWRAQGGHTVFRFEITDFLVNGHLPAPAV